MRRFLKNVLVFIAVNLMLVIAIGYYLEKDLPYYWGNPGLELKVDFLRSDQHYNTYFIGSSRTAEHINPLLFDSLTKNAGHSFNLGVPAFQAPESYYFLENFLKNEDHTDTEKIFFELAEMRSVDQNKFNVRGQYFLNFDYYRLATSDHLTRSDLSATTMVTLNYLTKITKIGLIKPIIKGEELRPEQSEMISTANKLMAGYYQPPHEKIISKNKLANFITGTNSYYEEQEEQNWGDRHLQKLNDLIDMADQKGIELIFILPPRIKMNVVSLFNQLPANRTIDLCNPSLYPQFYSIENSRDIYHLNDKGAREFTGVLSEKVLELSTQNGLLSRRAETY